MLHFINDRFNLIETVENLCNQTNFKAPHGPSYFIPGLCTGFNPRDDSRFQVIWVEYNPTLTVNSGSEESNGVWLDTLCKATEVLRTQLIQKFEEHWDGKTHVIEIGNGVTVATSYVAGVSMQFAESDSGFYVTYIETLI